MDVLSVLCSGVSHRWGLVKVLKTGGIGAHFQRNHRNLSTKPSQYFEGQSLPAAAYHTTVSSAEVLSLKSDSELKCSRVTYFPSHQRYRWVTNEGNTTETLPLSVQAGWDVVTVWWKFFFFWLKLLPSLKLTLISSSSSYNISLLYILFHPTKHDFVWYEDHTLIYSGLS